MPLPLSVDPLHLQDPNDGWSQVPTVEPQQRFSLVFPLSLDGDKPKLLLGLKKRGFGSGLYNGFGGKPEPAETMIACAQRELQEESGISVILEHLHYRGRLLVVRRTTSGQPPILAEIHWYNCTLFSGEPAESEEMRPQWFPLPLPGDAAAEASDYALPFDHMWAEARYYVPSLLHSAQSAETSELLLGRAEYDAAGNLLGWCIGWQRQPTQ